MTAQTVAHMRCYALEDSAAAEIQTLAYMATEGSNSQRESAERIHAFIRQAVRFQNDADTARPFAIDPEQAEVLIRPVDLIRMPQPAGDCDDFSMLAAAMLAALNIDCSFKTVACEKSDPDTYSHVYVVAYVDGGQRLPLDCSHGQYPGWEVKATGRQKEWKVSNNLMMRNLSGYDPVDGSYTPDTPDPSSTVTLNLPIFGANAPSPAQVAATTAAQSASSSSTAPAFDFNSLAQTLTKATAGILTANYGQPQLPVGTYIQTANGVMYRQPAGAASLNPVGAGLPLTTGGSSSLLMIGAVLAVVVIVISMSSHK